ncbi:hypothetical protein EVAR_36315_1 [Eumeta japonica]|uniref:Uncharacterized protein n=1 Tax=Eumeta variegata TaxID=151549 RepID=A0A4C1VI73_EUMVA|nr:hypothetical protein EVAR_36315_1 [Eumeta japonica]
MRRKLRYGLAWSGVCTWKTTTHQLRPYSGLRPPAFDSLTSPSALLRCNLVNSPKVASSPVTNCRPKCAPFEITLVSRTHSARLGGRAVDVCITARTYFRLVTSDTTRRYFF